MKIGYLFAGQGAQKQGMGKDFYETFEASKVVFDEANLALGYDLKDLIFNGTQEALNETEVTQPAILTTSVAMLKAFESLIDLSPSACAGLSLGEYSAHVSAGSIAFADAVKLVRKRGAFMQDAVPLGIGGMTALMGLTPEQADQVAEKASEHGIVEVCNYNAPNQIVIGGELSALEMAHEYAKAEGARRIFPLPVSAPFHTSMLLPAEKNLAVELEKITFNEMRTPVITNVDGRIVSSTDDIPVYLAKQVTSSVRWIECIEAMKQLGIDTLVEFGPGNALSGFVSKIDKSLKIISIYDIETLHAAVDTLKELTIEKAI